MWLGGQTRLTDLVAEAPALLGQLLAHLHDLAPQPALQRAQRGLVQCVAVRHLAAGGGGRA